MTVKKIKKNTTTKTTITKRSKTAPSASGAKAIKKVEGQNLQQELIEEMIERGRKKGVLAYEEVMDFAERNHLGETDTADLLKTLEKEHIELVMQEELEADSSALEEFGEEAADSKILFKSQIESSIDNISSDEEEEEEGDSDDTEKESVRETSESGYISDSVKCYLRDIGKIPLLNKKTEGVISDQIFNSKKESIESLSKFPFIHKEVINIGDRLAKDTLPLKEVIQFSEFDEENLPKEKSFTCKY